MEMQNQRVVEQSQSEKSIFHPQPIPNDFTNTLVFKKEIDQATLIELKYFEEYKKIYLTSFKLHNQIKKQVKNKENLVYRIHHMENQIVNLHKAKRLEDVSEDQDDGEASSKRKNSKRTRRTAEEIERKYYCQAEFCDRCYGSDGSLQQHIKLKHPQLYKRDDESLENENHF